MPSKIRRDARLLKGLCGECGTKPRQEGKTKCWECSLIDVKVRLRRVLAGLCTMCGGERTNTKKKCCASCRMKARDRADRRPARFTPIHYTENHA